MSAYRQFEREEQLLERQLADGLLTVREFNEALRDLERDYRAEAEQAAEEAYRRELENW